MRLTKKLSNRVLTATTVAALAATAWSAGRDQVGGHHDKTKKPAAGSPSDAATSRPHSRPEQVREYLRRDRDRCDTDTGDLVHHSDRGTQYLSIRYTERLADAGIELSVGSRGDAYDNALAETVIGLFKTEVIRRRGPWRSLEAVEFATLEWVDWFNHRRLLEPIGYVPPAEYEARYYEQAAVA